MIRDRYDGIASKPSTQTCPLPVRRLAQKPGAPAPLRPVPCDAGENMTMQRFIRAAPAAPAAAAAPATAATAQPRDTTVRTIRDTDGDNLLEYAPGEDYTYLGPEGASYRP